jgi:adenosylcobinamide kinase/adenosylcobinamide-phosphate guanylyltransferase|tara:strand:+ start:300 stop:818 length:519 start_codon:yes stop_codon:yes gene_type:complete
MIELILGGARSGKSRLALQKARDSGLALHYLATATTEDQEMEARISAHKAERDQDWSLVEEPVNLAAALLSLNQEKNCVLVDCVTLWISNCLHQEKWKEQREALLEILPSLKLHIIFVSNETGMGIVPLGELTRQFVDASGFFNQELGRICQIVTFVAAGLPIELKKQKSPS